MIDGHGDDAYKYGQKIRINFSSNVYNHVNHNGLREHLYHRMESIRSYPEPEPYSLEQALAHSLHLSDGKEVCVTNGATEAIYLIAQTFRGKNSAILMQNPGKVFSPAEIYRTVWAELPLNADNALAVHIRHIREKIEINPKEPRYLKVVWGVGYKIDKEQA